LYHHIYAWGNDKHQIFKDTAHFEKYLELLELYSARYDIDIVAYGLMNWHIHLFLLDLFGRLSRFMRCLHGRYAQFFNNSTGQVGHVFGERFNNKVVQANNYGLWLSRYIHRQAIEAEIVEDPLDYRWTSYCDYVGLTCERFLKPNIILRQFGRGNAARRSYEEFVLGDQEGPIDWSDTSEAIIGDNDFVKNFEFLRPRNRRDATRRRDLVEGVSCELGVDPESLLNPRGYTQRRLRHQAFTILAESHKLSAAEIGRMFRMCRSTVAKALKD